MWDETPVDFNIPEDYPEKYDLLRVRTGGWTGFFIMMFPALQAQHQRRPRSIPTG